jgi:hypothetical protein
VAPALSTNKSPVLCLQVSWNRSSSLVPSQPNGRVDGGVQRVNPSSSSHTGVDSSLQVLWYAPEHRPVAKTLFPACGQKRIRAISIRIARGVETGEGPKDTDPDALGRFYGAIMGVVEAALSAGLGLRPPARRTDRRRQPRRGPTHAQGRSLRMRGAISRDFPNRTPAEADLASTGPDPPRSLAR